jgi:hypothetical protein
VWTLQPINGTCSMYMLKFVIGPDVRVDTMTRATATGVSFRWLSSTQISYDCADYEDGPLPHSERVTSNTTSALYMAGFLRGFGHEKRQHREPDRIRLQIFDKYYPWSGPLSDNGAFHFELTGIFVQVGSENQNFLQNVVCLASVGS